jgi:penicillin-binding protein-related factor A (putative recombinase)
MKEKDFQSVFNKWLKHVHKQTGAFELKLCRNRAMPYSAVAPHQIDALLNAKHGTLIYKIPDVGYQNPFDCVSLSGVPAFVVVKYTSGKAYGIDIDDFIRFRDSSSRKSLTEADALTIHSFSF